VLDGTGLGVGILLVGRTNVTIQNFTLTNFQMVNMSSNFVVELSNSSGNFIFGNRFVNNDQSIHLVDSSNNNTVADNTFTNNYDAVLVASNSNANNILSNDIMHNIHGVLLVASSNHNTVSMNQITNSTVYGVNVDSSRFNSITGNNIENCHSGFGVYFSSNNSFSANNITNSFYGVYGSSSGNNTFYSNSFINNTNQVYFYSPILANAWDDGYFSGGNYWSNYAGADANHDGVGDIPFVIDASNRDRYPLTAPSSARPSTLQTTASLSVYPNPVGVGQTAQINMSISPPPPTTSDRFLGSRLTVTRPDGTTQTLGPFTSDTTGSGFALYTPTMVGNYTLQLTYPGQLFSSRNATYLPSSSQLATLRVQEQPVSSGKPSPTPTQTPTRLPTQTPTQSPSPTPTPSPKPATPKPTATVPTPTPVFVLQPKGGQTQKPSIPAAAIAAVAVALAAIVSAAVLLIKLRLKGGR